MIVKEQRKQIVRRKIASSVDSKGELLETSKSWIIRYDDRHLKINKPFPLENQKNEELHRQKKICERELTLNKPLAGDIYQDVVALSHRKNPEDSSRQSLTPVAWALQYKPLQRSNSLWSHLLHGNVPNSDQTRQLAEKIARFHLEEPPVKNTFNITAFREEYEESRRIEFFVRDLLHPSYYPLVLKSIDVVREFLEDFRLTLQERIISGYVRDGHGQISAENVYDPENPVIVRRPIDQRKRVNDVLFDIARLGIDFDFFKAYDTDKQFTHAYFNVFDQGDPDRAKQLYLFYKLVRINDLLTRTIDATTRYSLDASLKNRLNRYFGLMTNYLYEMTH